MYWVLFKDCDPDLARKQVGMAKEQARWPRRGEACYFQSRIGMLALTGDRARQGRGLVPDVGRMR